MGWMKTTATWCVLCSSCGRSPTLYNSFFLVFWGIPKMEWGRPPLSSLLNVSYNISMKWYIFHHKYTITSILIVQCKWIHVWCSLLFCYYVHLLHILFQFLTFCLSLPCCTFITHSVPVFDVLSQFAMLYMLLSLSLGWTLGTSYRFAHLQMVSRKPAAKVVGTLGILQVSGKSIHNQKN